MARIRPVTRLRAGNSSVSGSVHREHSGSGVLAAAAAAVAGSGAVSEEPADWQLGEGHYVPAKQAMMLIFPRPDNETSSNARHRWAYYDGVNPVEYRIPIGIAFGAPPFHFELIAGPNGMTVGEDYWDDDYGIVKWTPTGSETGTTCTVRVTDQESNTVDVSWTVSTSSSTSHFIFVDVDGGSDSGAGTIDDPFETLERAFGATFTATSNAGAVCYLRAGTYDLPGYTDNTINGSQEFFEMHTGRKPVALIGFPGETVILDATTGRFAWSSGANDFFCQDWTLDGYMETSNHRAISLGTGSRLTADNIGWTNAGYGTAGNSNATMFFGIGGLTREYLYLHECFETGRTPSGSDNSYGFCSLYSQNKGLLERCHFEGQPNRFYYLKGTNTDITVRYCTANAAGGTFGEGFSPNGDSNRIEWCYNKFKLNNGRMTNALESVVNNLWVYRNTFYACWIDFDNPNSGGPYVIQNNAIMTSSGTIVEAGSQVTVSGTECHGNLSSGIIDSTTLELLGTYRTNYLGTRGAEIA